MRFILMVSLLAVVGCGPGDYMPGVRLGGAPAETPTSFEFTQEHEVIQLEAQGSLLPYVVNLWCVALDAEIFVAGRADSGWVERLHERPNEVRARVGDNAYELRSELATDPDLRQRVFDEFLEKYGAEAINASVGKEDTLDATADDFPVIFRLSARV